MPEPDREAHRDPTPSAAHEPPVATPPEGVRPLASPVDVRTVALVGLLVLAVFYTCYLAATLILPLVVALLLNLLLAPLVQGLARFRIPPAVSALLVVAALVAALAGGVYMLATPAAQWVEKAPTTMSRVERKLRQFKKPVEQVQRAGEEVQRLTDMDAGARRTTVEVGTPSLTAVLFERTQAVVVGVAVVLVLLYYLLASGDLFLRKLIRAVPRIDALRAVSIARLLQRDLSRYLLTVTAINLALGALVAAAMHLLGMPNPLLWGVMVAVLNYVPYLGAIVGTGVIALVAVVTFDDVGQLLLAPLVYLVLTCTEGYLLTPMILGRRLTLNPLMILLSLLLWSWLWGIPGAILSVPMLASFKIFCDHVEPLRPVGQFLGR